MKTPSRPYILLNFLTLSLLLSIYTQTKIASYKIKEQKKQNNIILKKIDGLSKPSLANPHSTSSYKILSKVKVPDQQLQKSSVAKLKKIITDKSKASVIETSKSTDKHSSVIKQSMGVNNLSTLDDIFHKNEDLAPKKEQKKRQKDARKLNDSEASGGASEVSTLVAPSELSGAEEVYDEEHNLEAHGESETSDSDEEGEEQHEDSAFHIQDLERVDELTEKIKQDIKAEILGDLQNKMLIKALEVSYEVYEDINEVRKRYFFFKDSIEQSVQLLKDMVDYLEQFVTDSEEDENIQSALIRKGIEVDEHNHKLLVGLLIKLQELVDQLHTEIFETFDDYFKELNNVHFNQDMADSEKVRKMIQTASEISIFENNVVDHLTEQIKEVAKLSLDNPRYDHLSRAFAKEFVPPGEGVEESVKLSRLDKGVGLLETLLVAGLGVLMLG